MNTSIKFIDNKTNFDVLHKENKPTQVVKELKSVYAHYANKYKGLFRMYIDMVPREDKDTIMVSVYKGVVDLERPTVKFLGRVGYRYLVGLYKINNEYLNVAIKTSNKNKRRYTFLSASSYKRGLSEIKKLVKSELKEEEVAFFERWYSKNSPFGYVSLVVKSESNTKPKPEPIVVNNGYYTRLLGKLLVMRKSKTALLVMEMLTGRRITETNAINFKVLDVTLPEVRERIKKYYSIIEESVIDKYTWCDFSGQLKTKNEEKRQELGIERTYPIPLLLNISKEEFTFWADLLKAQVEKNNMRKGCDSELWSSEIGGLRTMRWYTSKLHKRLLPILQKAHNFRAIYASIISKGMEKHCNVSDNVRIMSKLLGHVDGHSTEKYRLIRVENVLLAGADNELISNLSDILSELFNEEGSVKKVETQFVGWNRSDKAMYGTYIKDPYHYDCLNVISEGRLDFDGLSALSAKEFRDKLEEVKEKSIEETGLSYRLITTRYKKVPFTVVYNLAKKTYKEGVGVLSLKSYLDREVSKWVKTPLS